MSEALQEGGVKALQTERQRRRTAERKVKELTERVTVAEQAAELWELRAKDNGRSVKWFKEQFLHYRELYRNASTSNNTNA